MIRNSFEKKKKSIRPKMISQATRKDAPFSKLLHSFFIHCALKKERKNRHRQWRPASIFSVGPVQKGKSISNRDPLLFVLPSFSRLIEPFRHRMAALFFCQPSQKSSFNHFPSY
jgi:hypothetical protein